MNAFYARIQQRDTSTLPGLAASDSASRSSFEALISAQGKSPTLKLLGFKKTPATPEVADRLGITPGEAIYCLQRQRFVDEQLIGLEIRYFLEEVGRRIPASGIDHKPTHDLLEIALNEPLGTVDVAVFAAAANSEISSKLKIRRGAPTLVREHSVRDSRERTVLFGTSIYRGNLRFQHVLRATVTVS